MMEKIKYECKTCESIFDLDVDKDISNYQCCEKPDFVILSAPNTEEGKRMVEEQDNRETMLQRDARKQFRKSYKEIMNLIDYYMDIPKEHLKLISVWILGTYLHETFSTYPFLFINAMRGSGKTRLLRLISHLSYKSQGEVLTGVTESTLFRTPKGVTMAFDEFESIGSKEKATFREYLNACYKAGGMVQRTKRVKGKEGESYEIENFTPYKPVVMANISGMEEVLADRSLTIILQKSSNPLKTKKIEDFEQNTTIIGIKRRILQIQCSQCSVVMVKGHWHKWNDYINLHYTLTTLHTLTTLTTLTNKEKEEAKIIQMFNNDDLEMYEKIDNLGIEGRNLELLFPLLITAKSIDNDTFEEMLEIGKNIINQKKTDEMVESRDVALIDFVANNFDQKIEFVPISDMTKHFKGYIGELEDFEDKWITTRWLGKALKRLGLVIESKRMAKGNEVMLNVGKAKEKLKMFK